MSQTVTLKIGTPLSSNPTGVASTSPLVLGADALVVFPTALDLDGVANELARISPAALAMNRVTAGLDRQELAVGAISNYPNLELGAGVLAYAAGDGLDITYGAYGEKKYTDRGVPPAVVSAVIEDAADTILVVTFDKDVNSASADFLTGFSCKVATVARVINSAARQVNNAVVHFTLASAVTVGQAVVFSYNKTTGNLKSDTGAALQSFTDAAVTNNVV